MTPLAEQHGKKDSHTERARRIHCEEMAGYWLHLGNVANEQGKIALAERHYAKAQKWHDTMNKLLGNV